MGEQATTDARKVAQRLVLDLTRRREAALEQIDLIESMTTNFAPYERGLAYAYSAALNAIERAFDD